MAATQEIFTEPRWCYWILSTEFDPGKGYVPVVITEGERGYKALRGRGEYAEPWYWGVDYGTAIDVALRANKELGLTLTDTVTIVQSSFFA